MTEIAWPTSLVSPPTDTEPLSRDEKKAGQTTEVLLPTKEDCNRNAVLFTAEVMRQKQTNEYK